MPSRLHVPGHAPAACAAGLLLVGLLIGLPATAVAQTVRAARQAPGAPDAELQRVQAELRRVDQLIVRLQERVRSTSSPVLLDSLQSTRQRQRQLRAQEQLLATRADDRTRVRLLATRTAEPRGWLGVEFNGAVVQHSPEGPMLVALNVPSIYSVTPGSPAARAGLAPGDRIVAIAGTDVRSGPVPLGTVLQPGRQVLFRIERGGQGRDVRVRITEAPQQWIASRTISGDAAMAALPQWETPWTVRIDSTGGDWAAILQMLARDSTAQRGLPGIQAALQGARLSFNLRGTSDSARPLTVARVRTGAPSPFVFSFDEVALLGAAFRGMTVGMRTELNAPDGGVIVVDVAPGTPAGRAGLRPLDVVVRANGELAMNPATLQRLVLAAEREVRLELVRELKPVRTTVRW